MSTRIHFLHTAIGKPAMIVQRKQEKLAGLEPSDQGSRALLQRLFDTANFEESDFTLKA